MSMIGVGRGVKKQANAGLANAARGESARNRMNDQIEDAADAEKKSTVGMLAGAGLEYGLKHATTAAVAEGTATAAGAATTAAATGAATTAAGTAAASGVAGTGVAAGGAAAGASAAAMAIPYVGIALLVAGLFS